MEILTIVFDALFFVAIVVILAQEQNHKYYWMEYLLVGASIAGVIIYGHGFYVVKGNIALAMIRSVMATLNMFLGKNEYNEIKDVAFMQNKVMICFFWIVHIIALFVTANAILTTIGAKALRHIKKIMAWLSDEVTIIYGTDDDCISFAKSVKGSIVVVNKKLGDDVRKTIEANGWVAIAEGRDSIFAIGLKKIKQVNLYCLREEEELNIKFAKSFLESAADYRSKGKIGKVALTLIADMATVDGSEFQKSIDHDGYDTVLVVDRPYLVAKTLVDNYQPCKTVRFDENCNADHDFHVVIVGFGKIGQAVLKNLYMNGQFLNARFKASIFDTSYSKINGILTEMNPSLHDNFLEPEIKGYEFDARQSQFYECLRENRVDYVCVCTGNDRMNRELANEITAFLKKKKRKFMVFECSYSGVTAHSESSYVEKKDVFVPDMLDINRVDKIAMEINYVYVGKNEKEKLTKEDAWASLSYFNRMSCRSAADFIPTYKYIVDSNGGKWNIEQLSKLEHLRWCAFYFASGYRPMSDEEFDERADKYLKDVEGFNHRFHKDEQDSFAHACLIPWDELPVLDKKQNSIFEKKKADRKVEYQKDDRNNVEIIKKLLEEQQ